MKPGYLFKLCIYLCLFFFTNYAFALDQSYQKFDRLLQKYVQVAGGQSKVDYDGFQRDRKELQEFIQEIEAVTRPEYDRWTQEEQLAFLINAYNALTIELILTKYPDVDSIKDLGGFFSSPWQQDFFQLFGETQDLDYIEHGLLRKKFQEPRIHFAIVCASISCPGLRKEAYKASSLEQQLSQAMKDFLQDRERNRYLPASRTLELSSIFKWFREDFEKNNGSLEAFVAPYITSKPEERRDILNNLDDIEFLDYDWGLNGRK